MMMYIVTAQRRLRKISIPNSIIQPDSLSTVRFQSSKTRSVVGASAVVRRQTLLVTGLCVSTARLGSASGTFLNDVALVDSILVVALCQCVSNCFMS